MSYIAGNKDEILITEGPYSICRNPLYLFSLIGAVGVGFSTETLIFPVLILAAFIIYYPFTIGREEVKLRAKFGNEYDNYIKKVKNRIVPSFRNFIEPDRIEISPKAFRRGIFDLIYFIVLVGVFECIETLHLAGWIPTLYYIK